MEKIVYTCDKCKKEGSEDYYPIKLLLDRGIAFYRDENSNPTDTIHLCCECFNTFTKIVDNFIKSKK